MIPPSETVVYRPSSSRTKKRLPVRALVVAVIAMAVCVVGAIAINNFRQSGVNVAPDNPTPSETEDPKTIDADLDGITDYNETRLFGTNSSNPDTDGDGMTDGWEGRFMQKDVRTGEWLLDPNAASDPYGDPDNDGYDLNHNGYIDGSEQDPKNMGLDAVHLSEWKYPGSALYTDVGIAKLLAGPEVYIGEMVRVSGARVADNGTYSDATTSFESELTITITDGSSSAMLSVILEPRSNRPLRLSDGKLGPNFPADKVDVQGVFMGDGNFWRLECRGTERFTNIMESLSARDYDGDGAINMTDPLKWDTDGDGMSDGWENHFGRGFFSTSSTAPGWEWVVHLDPTSPDDAWGEGNMLTDIDADRIQVEDEAAGGLRWVGYNRDEYLTVLDHELERQVPAGMRNLASMLSNKSIPRQWYSYGTDPASADTDRDCFDAGNDGYTPGVDVNANDFMELLLYRTDPFRPDTDGDNMTDGWEVHYGLSATNTSDRGLDPDDDGLPNWQEFLYRTNPRRWDTDDEGAPSRDVNAESDDPDDPGCFDGMPDGWEVAFGLDPLDPADAMHDSDIIFIGGVPVARPDGLLNLYEYRNGTNPKNPDTDGDHLSDYEEIVVGWDITVNGRQERFFSCASSVDTDNDTGLAPPLSTGTPPGPAGSEYLEPNQTDTRHDLNDWNEVVYHHTNASSADTDGDGLSDGVELFTDRDTALREAQCTDPRNADTDGDGLNDSVETSGLKLWLPESAAPVVVIPSPFKNDTDDDGLTDAQEVMFDQLPKDITGCTQLTIRLVLGADELYAPTYDPDIGKRVDTCDPTNADTDGDGIPDGYEFNNSDPDCDGLPTCWELAMGQGRLNPWKQDTDDNGIPDMMEDLDGDGLNNLEEYRHRTDPLDPDSAIPGLEEPPGVASPVSRADNGIKDGDEGMLGADKSQPFKDQWGHSILPRQPIYSDSDGDMMPDWWEMVHRLNPHANDSGDDADIDGFANIDEYIYGTNPETADTDKDGTADWQDHPFTFSPYCIDRDRDGIGDWWEKYWFGSIEACDPSANPDGPWDPESGYFGDNWTNLLEWRNSPWGQNDFLYRTNPKNNDTDGDGINDDVDPYPVRIPFLSTPMNPADRGATMSPVVKNPSGGDGDQDGMSNIDEYRYPNGTLDPADPDSDRDGMPDGWELEYQLNPLDANDALADPDNDGVNYSLKWTDLNGNKWPDAGEFLVTVNDFNGDGLIDPYFENESYCRLEEYWFGRDTDADGIREDTDDPAKADTDGDGMLDGYEMAFTDYDGDGMNNVNELRWGLDPLDPEGNNGSLGDIDGDGYTNLEEIGNNTNPRDPADYPWTHGRNGGGNTLPEGCRTQDE